MQAGLLWCCHSIQQYGALYSSEPFVEGSAVVGLHVAAPASSMSIVFLDDEWETDQGMQLGFGG